MDTFQRLISLDAFRGATIAGMFLVNNPGSWEYIYPQLKHAAWHGWTFTDWIFPFFLFVVGVAMTFSFARRIEQGYARRELLLHLVRRSAIIFTLGIFLNGFPFGLIFNHEFSWATIRIPGVLQRIAVCYLAVGVLFLYSNSRGRLIWTVALLGGYWLLVKLVPVPGYGGGIMDPAGNLCWYVDSTVLGGHTWALAPVPGFDPEGIVSTIPAIATTLIGVLTGELLRSEGTKDGKIAWMFVIGNGMLLLGTILDMWLPINKNMWTSSYSILMAGWALICLATLSWLIDVKGYTRWATPFVVFGMNAITIYVLAGMLATVLSVISWTQPDGSVVTLHGHIYEQYFAPIASPMNASLLYAFTFVLVMYFVAFVMWKRRWFIKV